MAISAYYRPDSIEYTKAHELAMTAIGLVAETRRNHGDFPHQNRIAQITLNLAGFYYKLAKVHGFDPTREIHSRSRQ